MALDLCSHAYRDNPFQLVISSEYVRKRLPIIDNSLKRCHCYLMSAEASDYAFRSKLEETSFDPILFFLEHNSSDTKDEVIYYESSMLHHFVNEYKLREIIIALGNNSSTASRIINWINLKSSPTSEYFDGDSYGHEFPNVLMSDVEPDARHYYRISAFQDVVTYIDRIHLSMRAGDDKQNTATGTVGVKIRDVFEQVYDYSANCAEIIAG